jgi:hypothetical protein
MSSPTSEKNREPTLSLNARDLVAWFSGLGTAIAVNRVSNSDQHYFKVLLMVILVAAVIGATSLLRQEEKRSYLLRYTRPVLLTIAIPLTLLTAVTGNDYVMLITAALGVVAILATLENKAIVFIRLFGLVAIGAGVMMIALGWRSSSDSIGPYIGPILVYGVIAITISAGVALVVKGDDIFEHIKKIDFMARRGDQVLFIGIMALIAAVVGIFWAIFDQFARPVGLRLFFSRSAWPSPSSDPPSMCSSRPSVATGSRSLGVNCAWRGIPVSNIPHTVSL